MSNGQKPTKAQDALGNLKPERTMITITVNMRNGCEAEYSRLTCSLADVVNSAKLLHPDWASMVITLARKPADKTTGPGV